MRSIQRQLLWWLSGGILLAASIAGVAIYNSARHQANQLFDYQLQQAAISLPAHVNDEAVYPTEELNEEILIQVWNPQDKLIYTSNPAFSLPRYKQQGFQTVQAFDENWRLYIENRRVNYIQIAQPLSVRNALAAKLAIRSLAPFFILIPVMLALTAFIVRRSLSPLQNIAHSLGQRSPIDLQALDGRDLPEELSAIVQALNGWLTRLDSALTAQRDFVANAAHELRSPLTALKLQLQLTERASTEDKRLSGFSKLHERLNRTTHLVEQLLTLARHEAWQNQPLEEETRLGELVRTVSTDYGSIAESRQIHLFTSIFEPEIRIQGNRHSLEILLKNLLENAINHTPAGGEVHLATYREPDRAILRIIDTGCGISREERQHVYQRFYRCLGDNAPGTGLGLTIVKNIADQHQAHIQLDDNPNGSGLQVTVRFPLPKQRG